MSYQLPPDDVVWRIEGGELLEYVNAKKKLPKEEGFGFREIPLTEAR